MSQATSCHIEPIKPAIGAVITGIDLNHLDEQDQQFIYQALLKHQVLFFRQQSLSSQAQVSLAKSFGDLHIHPVFPTLPDFPEIIVLDSHQTDLRDNELWHTDVTFSQTPPLGCVLQAIKIPPKGGDTLWGSLTAAFEGLDEELKDQLRGKTATHDIRLSFPQERFGQNAHDDAILQDAITKNPPLSHPVVRTHPQTGKEGLFVTEGFTSHIDGMDRSQSDILLSHLFAHSTKDEFTLRWQWQEGDVVIWDNRCTQHKALFDYEDAHRIMHRATILGDRPFFQV